MAKTSDEMDELKQSLRSIVISSRKKPSIEELQKDYYSIEGRQLPFRRLGFKSTVELLQNMKDIFSIPSNPNEYSVVSMIGETKSDHLIQLIANQKPSTKRGRPRTSANRNGPNNKSSYSPKHYATNNNYNRSKSTSRPINHDNQLLSRSKSFCYDNTNNSSSHSNRNGTQQLSNAHNSTQYIGTNKGNFNKNNKSDAPEISLKLSEVINSKQSAGVDHSDKKITSVLNKNDDETPNITSRPKIRIDDFVNKCKIQNMMKPLEGLIVHKNSITEIKNKIDYVKRQSKIRLDKNNEIKNSNEIESYTLANAHLKCKSEIVAIAHSTPKQNDIENSVVSLNDIQLSSIPENILYRIAMVFSSYHNTMNCTLFLFVYMEFYHSIFEPKNYGFNSLIEFFKNFDHHFVVEDNVVSKNIDIPNHDKLLINENWSHQQNKIIDSVLSNNKEHISLNILQTLVYDSEICMKLSEAYDPSLFYLQLCSSTEDLNNLMKQMETFYEETNTKLCVQPEQVLVGSCYVTFYNEYINANKWRRVKIIREVNPTLVQVIQVDYGTVDYILKKNLRFLKKEFCDLPCQAIHCCLTNFNKLNRIERNVTIAFFEMVDINSIMVKVDSSIIVNKQNQVLHVTLFDQLKNINRELIICYV